MIYTAHLMLFAWHIARMGEKKNS